MLGYFFDSNQQPPMDRMAPPHKKRKTENMIKKETSKLNTKIKQCAKQPFLEFPSFNFLVFLNGCDLVRLELALNTLAWTAHQTPCYHSSNIEHFCEQYLALLFEKRVNFKYFGFLSNVNVIV